MSFSADRYVDALRFAAEKHAGQTLPGSDLPYVVHLSMVAIEVIGALEDAEDPDLAVSCALLHDTIEDTPATFEDLLERFGPNVAAGVLALTKDSALPKAERMQDSLRRIKLQPRSVWMVKLADRITNLQPPPHFWNDDKRRRYQAEAREIHAALSPSSRRLSARMVEKIEAYSSYIS